MNKNVSNNNKQSLNNSVLFLIELRTRLIYSLIFLMLVFSVLLFFANDLYTWLAFPIFKFLPNGRLIATQIVSPFLVPFKLALFVSMLISVPFFLYQAWGFISPALYRHERRLFWLFILTSVCLFYLGIAFAYKIIFPMLFHFFAHTAPEGVVLSPDMSEYFDFTTKLLFIFGILFEVPMIMVLLAYMGIVTRRRFAKARPYAIVIAFVLGMVFAPPDVLSQTLLAIPIWLLYEMGLIMLRFIPERRDEYKTQC